MVWGIDPPLKTNLPDAMGNALRLETEPASEQNGFPRDGVITLRIMNTVAQQAIKLSPDEALRISTQLLSVAKDLMQQKRLMWNHHED